MTKKHYYDIILKHKITLNGVVILIFGIILLLMWVGMVVLCSLHKKRKDSPFLGIAILLMIAFMVILYFCITSVQKDTAGVVAQERHYKYYINGVYAGSGTEKSMSPTTGNITVSILGGLIAFLLAQLLAKLFTMGKLFTSLILMFVFAITAIATLIGGIYFLNSSPLTREYREFGTVMLIISGVSFVSAVVSGIVMSKTAKKNGTLSLFSQNKENKE